MINLTLTGADETVDVDMLREMRFLEPENLEFGILVSWDTARPRYPRYPWIARAIQALPYKCALHICGGNARKFLLRGDYDEEVRHASRVQLNGPILYDDFITLSERLHGVTFVTQYVYTEQKLLDADLPFHEILMDTSGGRGISPSGWWAPFTSKRVGFVGGLGAHNLVEQLPKIKTVAGLNWWIDMESSLMGEDGHFSIEKAKAVINICKEYKA